MMIAPLPSSSMAAAHLERHCVTGAVPMVVGGRFGAVVVVVVVGGCEVVVVVVALVVVVVVVGGRVARVVVDGGVVVGGMRCRHDRIAGADANTTPPWLAHSAAGSSCRRNRRREGGRQQRRSTGCDCASPRAGLPPGDGQAMLPISQASPGSIMPLPH
jgi:hypothetical protein